MLAGLLLLPIGQALVSAFFGLIGALLVINYEIKRWAFNRAVEVRTNAILDAYDQFLNAFYKLYYAYATIGIETSLDNDEISRSIDNCQIAISKIDIWVSNENSKRLECIIDILSDFQLNILHATVATKIQKHMSSERKLPSTKSKEWTAFISSLEEVKHVISQELRSQELRTILFSA